MGDKQTDKNEKLVKSAPCIADFLRMTDEIKVFLGADENFRVSLMHA